MPYYKYECTEKGHEFNDLRAISLREENNTCPECGAVSMYKPTFTATLLYSAKDKSSNSLNQRWNLRENKRLKTRGKSYA